MAGLEAIARQLPIWGVTPQEQALYFGLFILFTLAGTLFLLAYDIFIAGTPAPIDILKDLVLQMAIIGVGAATLSLATVEAPKIIMVTGRYLQESLKRRLENQQQKLRAEGKAQGKAEGRAEGKAEGQAQERQLWLDWHRRFIEAQERGLPFNEPPPSGGQTDGS